MSGKGGLVSLFKVHAVPCVAVIVCVVCSPLESSEASKNVCVVNLILGTKLPLLYHSKGQHFKIVHVIVLF